MYGFAKQSGGFAAIDSKIGQGTSVKIYLPRTSLALTARSLAPDTAGADTGAGETMLVVEDDAQVRRYIVETLADLNYQVIEACDADEAVDMFNRHGRAIHLLLTDVIMPGRNGRIR